jgi:hypothetical protein
MAVAQSTGRRLWGLVMLAFAGCGRPTPPGVLAGESAHFRLYIDPEVDAPPEWAGENGLAALETEWTDVHSMLQMPDGKITYYWLAYDHVASACGDGSEGACTDEGSLEIDAPVLPDWHELTHAYMYLRNQRKPIPFLAEGIAEAIECGPDLPMNVADIPWEGVVAGLPSSDDVYEQGGAFVRHLIRNYGIDPFLRYYEQSPEQRDPAQFAANFQSFWNVPLDDVWTAIHSIPAGLVSEGETKICPCALPPLETSGPVTNDPARMPYWPLPDPAGQTLALWGGGYPVLVKDCAGIRPPLWGSSVLARLDGNDPRYVLAPLTNATVGSYVADTCAEAAPYPFPPIETVAGNLEIAVPTPADAVTCYVNLASSFSGALLVQSLQETCADCGFDQGSCQPIGPTAVPAVQGPLYGRMTLYRSIDMLTDVVTHDIEILHQ